MKELEIEINKPVEEIKFNDLSTGMSQRLFVAMVIKNNPKFIIGDEITSALDVKNTINLMNLISKYVKEKDSIFFLITHDLVVAKSLVDEIYYILNKTVIKLKKEKI